jgi:hypothetical protein
VQQHDGKTLVGILLLLLLRSVALPLEVHQKFCVLFRVVLESFEIWLIQFIISLRYCIISSESETIRLHAIPSFSIAYEWHRAHLG